MERAEFLRIFPSGYNLDHRFPRIEDWIAREYAPVEPALRLKGYDLYRPADR
jgi:hypothetical protein